MATNDTTATLNLPNNQSVTVTIRPNAPLPLVGDPPPYFQSIGQAEQYYSRKFQQSVTGRLNNSSTALSSTTAAPQTTNRTNTFAANPINLDGPANAASGVTMNNSTGALDDSSYLPNPLSQVQQPAYYWKFFMISDIDAINIKKAFELKQNDTSVGTVLDSLHKFVIAETGATGFNIKNVEIDNTIGPTPKFEFTSALGIKMEIVEPYSISLINRIMAAAELLDIKDYRNCAYFLELKFQGYHPVTFDAIDQIGPLTDVRNNASNNAPRRWIYMVKILNIETALDNTGSRYTFDMVQIDDFPFFNNFAVLSNTTSFTGNTVGDFINQLKAQLAKDDVQKYGYPRHEYDIQIQKIDPNFQSIVNIPQTDPMQWVVNFQNPEEGSGITQGTTPFNSDKLIGTNTAGTAIEEVIVALLNRTEESRKILARNQDTPNSPSADAQNTSIWKAFSRCDLRDPPNHYDNIYGGYNYKFTYYIYPFTAVGVMASDAQRQNLDNIDLQQQRQMDNKRSMRLRKKYEYLYSGLNIEVLDFNINFDMMWYSPLPLWSARYYWENFNTARSYNFVRDTFSNQNNGSISLLLNTTSSGALQEIQRRASQNAQLAQFANQESGGPISPTDRFQAQQSVVDQAQFLQQQSVQGNSTSVPLAAGSELYIEDINDMPSFKPSKFRSFDLDAKRMDFEDTHSFEQSINGGEHLTSTIRNQLVSASSSLANIKLTIKGDPYWIGYTSMDSQYFDRIPTQSSFHPHFNEGQQLIELRFYFPQGVDQNGNPILKPDYIFSGVYSIISIVHKFVDGKFTSEIDATLDPNSFLNVGGVITNGGSQTIDSSIPPSKNTSSTTSSGSNKLDPTTLLSGSGPTGNTLPSRPDTPQS